MHHVADIPRAGLRALLAAACLARGCARQAGPAAAPAPASAPVAPRSLGFTQDGLRNCGTLAMLLSWAHAHPDYDAKTKRVRMRNPRRAASTPIPLGEFRERSQLAVVVW